MVKMKTSVFAEFLADVFNGMGLGLFLSLVMGIILNQAGALFAMPLLVHLGGLAQIMTGPAIAVCISCGLSAPPLSIFSSLVVGALGAGTFNGSFPVPGEPLGAAAAAIAGAVVGKLATGKLGKNMDLLLVPIVTVVAGGFAAVTVAPWIAKGVKNFGYFINMAVTLHPILMGMTVSCVMGLLVTLPVGVQAISVSLGLFGLAAGAATAGCCSQMVGFAVMSFKENGLGGMIAQGLGTSMLQMPNIVRNPWIWLPPTLSSIAMGALSTSLFKMNGTALGAGMGSSGLVGQLQTFAVMGSSAWPGVLMLHFALPAAFCLTMEHSFSSMGLIRFGDMSIE